MRVRQFGALVFLAVFAAMSLAGTLPHAPQSFPAKEYKLFNGTNNADSSERASIWIPIRGASRVYIRTWSAGASADSDFCDTITTWKTMLAESVLFVARDSSGTIVTALSGHTGPLSDEFPMCTDSIVITGDAADSTKMVGVYGAPQGTAKLIRGTVSGDGVVTVVYPTPAPAGIPTGGVNLPNTPDVFAVGYLRIRYTPRTRLTTAGFSSTSGLRTRGINKLRVWATVLYPNP